MTAATAESNRWRLMLTRFAQAPLRFPVPLACAVLWAGITIAREHRLDFTDRQTLYQIQVFLLLGLFLSLSAKLFAESRDWNPVRWLPLTAGVLGLLALIVFLGPEARSIIENPTFLFMGPGLILLMIVSPFLRRGVDNRLIWDFNFKSWTSAAFGLLIALVLALGTSAMFGALNLLFDLGISRKYFWDIWVVCMSVIWPWQTLAGVPGGFGNPDQEYCPRWFANLTSWLLVPLAMIYLVLLYAFAAKIAFQWTLPRGQIAWLVGGFAGFGVAVWHTAHPLRETGNRLGQIYVRFFHPALFAPVALLAVGIGARVLEYGVTEKRYGLVVLTLWLAGIAVHGAVARTPRLNIAPVSFAVLLILASFGPWGATAVSLHSQFAQLDSLLVRAGILRDGKLTKLAEPVDFEQGKRISSVINYLNHPESRQLLFAYLKDGGIELEVTYQSNLIATALGLEYINYLGRPQFQSWWRPTPYVGAVRGFDAAVEMRLRAKIRSSQSIEIGGSETRLQAELSRNILSISTTAQGPVTVDLVQIVETLRRDGGDVYDNTVNGPLMTVDAWGNGLKTRIYFTSIQNLGTISPVNIWEISFTALIGLYPTQ